MKYPLRRLDALGCAFLVTLACLLSACRQHRVAPRAAGGHLDLSGWDLVQQGSVNLDGEWEVYWRQLLTPEDLRREVPPSPNGLVNLPGTFASQKLSGTILDDLGFGTFRLRIKGLSPQTGPRALRIPGVCSAYRLWANGELILANGQVGSTEDTTIPTIVPRVPTINSNEPALDLVIQVANFHTWEGGITNSIELGPEDHLHRKQYLLESVDIGLFGALLAIGLYHVVVYLLRRKELGALHISACCFVWGLRIPVVGLSGRMRWPLFPGLPWKAGVLVENSGYMFGAAAIILFLAWVHPHRHCRVVARFATISAAVLTLVILVLPSQLADEVGTSYIPIGGLIAFYAVATSWWYARTDRRPGSIFVLIGFVVLGAAGVNDMLVGVGVLHSANLMPVGVFGFVLSQAIVVAARLNAAFVAVETLSHKLELTNKELQLKDKLKDDFLARTSHELKTPLHGMVGIADSLIKGVGGLVPAKVGENLALIVGSGRRLTELVNDILDFSRLKHSDIQLKISPVHVPSLTQTVLDVLDPLARRKQISLVNEVPNDIALVAADEDRLHQILCNLVGNSIKFTAHGSIRVQARSLGDFVEVSVIDSGMGIPQDKIDTIFESFAQLNPTNEAAGGVGLGLAISRQLVELHGGRIRVSSQMGVGSTFCFAIPIAKGSIALSAHPAAPAPILSTEPEQEQPLSLANQKQEGATASELPGRVLVVDDEPVNLQVVANHLSLQGMTVQTACCGPDALQIIDGANAPDLVLLDVMMPQMNGFEVCRAIRNRKNLSELPVVLLTALSRKEDVVCGFAAGANDYLTKPFHGEELVARVRSQLSVRNALAATKDNLRLAAEVNEGKLAEARARLDAERASLETLRYQLNPHFLMNALAAIRGAIGEAPDTARHAISDLSEFCRLTLRRAPVETLTVEEELEMIRLFLRIHKTRWGDYLKVSTEIDTSMLRAKIPAWLLQPIVENALKHGMRTSPRSLEIRMVGHRRDKNALVFRVSNTGHYVALDESQGESTGIGMENLRKRLEKWYPEGHSLTLTDESGWVHVELTLVENALTTETQTLGADALSISQESN